MTDAGLASVAAVIGIICLVLVVISWWMPNGKDKKK